MFCIVSQRFVFSRSTRNIYTENLREALASDTYVLRGDPVSEVFEPTYNIFLCHLFLIPLFRLVSPYMVFVLFLYLPHHIQ